MEQGSADADDSFEEFYAWASRRLVGQIFAITNDLDEAEDILQEAFVRTSMRWERLRKYDVPEAWVRRVAVNLALNGFRRAKRTLVLLARLGPPQHAPELSADNVATSQALAQVPRRYREVLVLHYLVDLSVAEVAAHLRIPAGTVKARLHRGRRLLATQFDVAPAACAEVEGHA